MLNAEVNRSAILRRRLEGPPFFHTTFTFKFSIFTAESDANDTALAAKGTGKSLFGAVFAYMLIVEAASERQRSKEGQYAKSTRTQCNDGCDGHFDGTARAANVDDAILIALRFHQCHIDDDSPLRRDSGRTMEAWR
jgi:hypothetical protein